MSPEMLAASLVTLYNQGGIFTPEQLGKLYSDDVTFTDPVHSITGLKSLCNYLNNQYKNVKQCEFTLKNEWIVDGNLFMQWDMTLRHPQLNSGDIIIVNGFSHLQFLINSDSNALIFTHRDFFDLGQLLYENVALIGKINRLLKKGLNA